MSYHRNTEPFLLKEGRDFACDDRFSTSRPNGTYREGGNPTPDHCFSWTEKEKIGAAGKDERCFFHYLLVGNIAVGKGNLLRSHFFEKSWEFFFRVDRNTLRIIFSREARRVDPVGNRGYLGGRKGDHPVGRSISEKRVEIMEIPSSGPQDDHRGRATLSSSLLGFSPTALLFHRMTQGRGRKSFS
jgi:hypothetical protein